VTDANPSPAVLWLLPDGAAHSSPLADNLGVDHRVRFVSESAVDALGLAAIAPALDHFVLIARSSGAATAVALSRSAGAACTALVLLAPVLEPMPPAEDAPDLPILLVLGTDDPRVPPSSAASLRAALPRADVVLVYDAGHALDRDRVDAVASLVRDFILRPTKFLVRNASDVLYS